MAFEEAIRTFKKAKDIPLGQSLIGYVVGFYNSATYPEIDCLEMVTESGEKFTLSPTGNLKYFKKNNWPVGVLYKFTRLEDKLNKRGTKSCNFKVEYDTSKTVVVPQLTVVGTIDDPNASKIPF